MVRRCDRLRFFSVEDMTGAEACAAPLSHDVLQLQRPARSHIP
jgi:hypothetical protein